MKIRAQQRTVGFQIEASKDLAPVTKTTISQTTVVEKSNFQQQTIRSMKLTGDNSTQCGQQNEMTE